MRPPFGPFDVGDAPVALRDALAERRAAAEAEAAVMHERRASGHVHRVSGYAGSATYPATVAPFPSTYPNWDTFAGALLDAEPGAIETALDLLSRIAPAAALPIALDLAARRPWSLLWDTIGRAFARSDDPRAWDALFAHAAEHGVAGRIAESAFRDGLDRARATIEANDPLLTGPLCAWVGRQPGDEAYEVLAARHRALRDLPSGLALLGRADPRSLDVLEEGLSLAGDALALGVRAAIARDPARAVERLGGVDALTAPDREPVAGALLEHLGRGLQDRTFAAAPDHVALARRFLRHPRHKSVALWVVRGAGGSDPAAPPKPARRAAPAALPEVDPALAAAMTTARANVERVAKRLRREGYVFAPPRRPLARPSPRLVAKLERAAGPLPPALRALYEVFGGCDLRGTHPGWPGTAHVEVRPPGALNVWYTDPLVVLPLASVLDEALEDAADGAAFDLPLAPDRTGKAGFSGGSVTVTLPSREADPALGGAPGHLLEHLRAALRWGGFPGFASVDDPPPLIAELAALCEPF
ncbi:MAG: hypothetical protein JNL38_12800 [Myxococcales bacterium]|nr:hypothetical protein [Myxococcales bacterium]